MFITWTLVELGCTMLTYIDATMLTYIVLSICDSKSVECLWKLHLLPDEHSVSSVHPWDKCIQSAECLCYIQMATRIMQRACHTGDVHGPACYAVESPAGSSDVVFLWLAAAGSVEPDFADLSASTFTQILYVLFTRQPAEGIMSIALATGQHSYICIGFNIL